MREGYAIAGKISTACARWKESPYLSREINRTRAMERMQGGSVGRGWYPVGAGRGGGMADAADLNSAAARREGSNPSPGTRIEGHPQRGWMKIND